MFIREFPPELNYRLKLIALQKRIPLKTLVIEALEKFAEAEEKKK